MARFRREAEITARLDHPSIPPVYEAGVDAQGRRYLLMRLIEGEPLWRRIEALHQDGGAPDLRALRPLLEALVKVGEAVAHAHARRMVHRDLKPQNVMVGRYGEVLVMDWGLVRLLDAPADDAAPPRAPRADAAPDLTLAGTLLGTPGYMSPEQAGGEPVDERADVFSLGAMLVAVLTGRPPVTGATAINVINATCQGRIARPRDRWPRCPRDLDAIAARALAVDPAARTATAEAFVAELRAWLLGDDVPGFRYGPVERLLRAARRRPAALVGATAVALALGVAGALGSSLVEQRQARRRMTDALGALDDAAAAAARADRPATLAAVSSALSTARDVRAVRLAAARLHDAVGAFDAARDLLEPTLPGLDDPSPELLLLHRVRLHEDPDRWIVERTPEMQQLIVAVDVEGRDDALAWFGRGVKAMPGALEVAVDAFTRALECDKDMALARVSLSAALAALGRHRESAAELRTVQGLPDTDVALRWRVHLGLAHAHLVAHDPARAREQADRALALLPNTREPRLTRAAALVSLGDPAAGLEELALLEGMARPERLHLARAQALRALGRHDDAVAALESGRRVAPDDPELRVERLANLSEVGDLDGVRREAEWLLESMRDDGRTLATIGGFFMQAGDLEGGLALVDRAVALAPRDPYVLPTRALARLMRGDTAGALADLEAALAIDGRWANARTLRANVRLAAGDLAGAAEDVEAVWEEAPATNDALVLRATLNERRGRLDEALADASTVLARTPGNARARLVRARVRRARKELAGALDDLDQVIASRRWAEALLERARTLADLGELEEAYRIATGLIDDTPMGVEARVARAEFSALGGGLDSALAEVDAALTLDPRKVSALLLRARLRLRAGDPRGALADAEALRRVAPDLPIAGVLRADALISLGDPATAIEVASAVIDRDPALAAAWLSRAAARLQTGDARGAEEDATRSLRLDPELNRRWGRCYRATARLRLGDARGAAEDATILLRAHPHELTGWQLRAEAYALLGELDAAIADLERALAIVEPTRPLARQLRAKVDELRARQR